MHQIIAATLKNRPYNNSDLESTADQTDTLFIRSVNLSTYFFTIMPSFDSWDDHIRSLRALTDAIVSNNLELKPFPYSSLDRLFEDIAENAEAELPRFGTEASGWREKGAPFYAEWAAFRLSSEETHQAFRVRSGSIEDEEATEGQVGSIE